MIIWINGAFGSGKTSAAEELHRRIAGSFIFDPENLGYFIRQNSPGIYADGDFQDIPFWREGNYRLLSMLSADYDGHLIVPMTISDRGYYDEIITKLRQNGCDVRHFILYAERETILRRLKKRSGSLKREKFAVDAIERCLEAYSNTITDEKIHTDNMTVREVSEAIAERCGIELLPDNRSVVQRFIDRIGITLKYLR